LAGEADVVEVAAMDGKVAAGVAAVGVRVGVDGNGEGVLAAREVIMACAVRAAAVSTACGSMVWVASGCPPGWQDARSRESASKAGQRVFRKLKISPPEVFEPHKYNR
jgi:hypothetical protein